MSTKCLDKFQFATFCAPAAALLASPSGFGALCKPQGNELGAQHDGLVPLEMRPASHAHLKALLLLPPALFLPLAALTTCQALRIDCYHAVWSVDMLNLNTCSCIYTHAAKLFSS